MRPDRILLGEVRGEEAFGLVQALNTGHQGTLSTTHANSAALSLTRFATCVMMAGIDLPHRMVRADIGEALNLIVHIDRRSGKRFVNEVLRVKGYDATEDRYELEFCAPRRHCQLEHFDAIPWRSADVPQLVQTAVAALPRLNDRDLHRR